MPYVWMDEVTRVPTVGENGMGVTPAVPVEEVQKVSGAGIEMEKSGKESVIPNPGATSNNKVLKVSSGKWTAGTDSATDSRLPSASGKTDGQVLTVSSGAWTVADNVEGLPDASNLVDETPLLVSSGEWTVSEQPEPEELGEPGVS